MKANLQVQQVDRGVRAVVVGACGAKLAAEVPTAAAKATPAAPLQLPLQGDSTACMETFVSLTSQLMSYNGKAESFRDLDWRHMPWQGHPRRQSQSG